MLTWNSEKVNSLQSGPKSHHFYRAAWNADMQTRYSDEKAVRLSVYLSVRPSVCQTRGL